MSVVQFLLFKRTSCLSFDLFEKTLVLDMVLHISTLPILFQKFPGMSNFKLDSILTTYTYPKTENFQVISTL